ncbi:MAG: hypothetical protein U0103_21740 [Candidatus Obscuribacterales bacterium]
MIIKLYQPPTKNWLLIAEQLDDPPTWDRFVPCHSASSQRWQFDKVAKELANGLRFKPCKDLLFRGTSVFEYDWETVEDDILAHALLVADAFGLEIRMEAPDSPVGRTAA